MGRLSKPKGQWHLIRAFKKVKETIKDMKLIILGRGELEDYLKQLVEELNLEKDVYFLGFQKNPFKFISKSKIYLFPSLYEGFGFPVIEAMACGIPVVCSDKASLPEVAGDASLFCSTDDYEEISIKIEQVLSDDQLKNEMVDKGFQQARKFTWEKTAETVLSSYKELLQ